MKEAWEKGSTADKVEIAAAGIGMGAQVIPYAGDYIALGASTTSFIAKPSLDKAGDVALDAVGAVLPIVPALGTVHRAEKITEAAGAANKLEKAVDATNSTEKVIDITKKVENTTDFNPHRLNSARREARKSAIADLRESIETGVYSPQAKYAAERIEKIHGREALIEFKETGKLPDDFELSHLFSASEHPEFAHKGDLAVITDAKDHRLGHHDGNTNVPLHGSPRNADWESSWGTQEIDASTKEGRDYLGLTDD